MTTPTQVLARGVLLRASRFPEYRAGAGLRVRAGRVHAVTRALPRGGTDEELLDLSELVLVPGLVNAHAHLELGGLRGALPGDQGFGAWVGALMRARDARGDALVADAEAGLRACLRAGVTTVGDIATTDAVEARFASPAGPGAAPRVRLYREALDAWDPERTAGALERAARPWPDHPQLHPGLSPHAPFTVSAALFEGLVRAHPRLPRAVHWSETPEEVEWLARGTGPWTAVLGDSPRTSGLDLLENAGLLGPGTTLVHANEATDAELDRVAEAGAPVVHCPGTHAFFGRDPLAVRALGRDDLGLAVGTDSLASNDTLDLMVELRRMAAYGLGFEPLHLLEMATVGGARAVGLAEVVGSLAPGHAADAVALAVDADTAEGIAAAWLAGEAEVRGVLVAGRWYDSSELGSEPA